MQRFKNSPLSRSPLSLTLVIIFSISFLLNANALVVGGHISEDTTWSPANNPYQITENLIVDIGVTLTILAGTEIQIKSATCSSYTEWAQNFSLNNPDYQARMIEVDGRIIAKGTEVQRISFSRLTDEVNHCWGTIYSTPHSDLSFFEYCDFEDSAGMITTEIGQIHAALEFNTGNAFIRNCFFKNNKQSFNFSSSAMNVEIVNNQFTYDINHNYYIYNDQRTMHVNPTFAEIPPLIAGNNFLRPFSLSVTSSYFVENILNSLANGEAHEKPMYFYKNDITGNYGGIETDGNSTNYIKKNILNNVTGIEVDDSYAEIIDNQLNGSRIRVYNSPNTIISHNILSDCNGDSPAIGANCGVITNNIIKNAELGYSGSATAQFSNNLIINNENVSSSFSDNGYIMNQIIVGNDDIFDHTDSVYGYPVFRNCILDFELPEGCIDGGGNHFIEPSQVPNLFVDLENENFHLASGSIAIDAGFNTPGYYPFDLDYNQRVYDGDNNGNARIDIGPYEFGAPPAGKVCGNITSSDNENPIDYVFISVDNDPGNYTFADSSGYFEIHLPEGTYDLYAKRIFYEENVIYTVSVQNDEITELNFNMSSTLDPVEVEEEEVPNSFFRASLSNYPNPFNPTTTISFNLTTECTESTEIEIYNVKGQKVKSFPPSSCHPEPVEGRGENNTSYSVSWNGTDTNNNPVSSGIYFATLKANNRVLASHKMILMK